MIYFSHNRHIYTNPLFCHIGHSGCMVCCLYCLGALVRGLESRSKHVCVFLYCAVLCT
jgi:hypothetical protein